MGLVPCMVRREGFEPRRPKPARLQRAPFDRLGIDAKILISATMLRIGGFNFGKEPSQISTSR